MHYEVDPTAIHGEAAVMTQAAENARLVSVQSPFATLREALPSGSTAASVRAIASAWQVALADVRLGVGSLAGSLDAAAQGYERVEAMAAVAFDAVA